MCGRKNKISDGNPIFYGIIPLSRGPPNLCGPGKCIFPYTHLPMPPQTSDIFLLHRVYPPIQSVVSPSGLHEDAAGGNSHVQVAGDSPICLSARHSSWVLFQVVAHNATMQTLDLLQDLDFVINFPSTRITHLGVDIDTGVVKIHSSLYRFQKMQ